MRFATHNKLNKLIFKVKAIDAPYPSVQCIFNGEHKMYQNTNYIKAIGGINHVFYKFNLIYRVFIKLQVGFYHLKKFKLVFEI